MTQISNPYNFSAFLLKALESSYNALMAEIAKSPLLVDMLADRFQRTDVHL